MSFSVINTFFSGKFTRLQHESGLQSPPKQGQILHFPGLAFTTIIPDPTITTTTTTNPLSRSIQGSQKTQRQKHAYQGCTWIHFWKPETRIDFSKPESWTGKSLVSWNMKFLNQEIFDVNVDITFLVIENFLATARPAACKAKNLWKKFDEICGKKASGGS